MRVFEPGNPSGFFRECLCLNADSPTGLAAGPGRSKTGVSGGANQNGGRTGAKWPYLSQPRTRTGFHEGPLELAFVCFTSGEI